MNISFCIITNGKRPDKLDLELASIQALNIEHCEILVAGDLPAGEWPIDDWLPEVEAAKNGRLADMRHRACSAAKYPVIVGLDDDYILHGNFYDGLLKYGDFDVLSCVTLNPDGKRFWDWKTWVNGLNTLIPYEQKDGIGTGGLYVITREAYKKSPWKADPPDDVTFWFRARANGLRVEFNPHSAATHNDDQYFTEYPFIYRR